VLRWWRGSFRSATLPKIDSQVAFSAKVANYTETASESLATATTKDLAAPCWALAGASAPSCTARGQQRCYGGRVRAAMAAVAPPAG
jgi:hypothetical protein